MRISFYVGTCFYSDKSNEIERGKTIKIRYAELRIHNCAGNKCSTGDLSCSVSARD